MWDKKVNLENIMLSAKHVEKQNKSSYMALVLVYLLHISPNDESSSVASETFLSELFMRKRCSVLQMFSVNKTVSRSVHRLFPNKLSPQGLLRLLLAEESSRDININC